MSNADLIARLRAEHASHFDTVGDLLFEAARALESSDASATAAVAELDKIEDRAPHDIDGMIYTIPWAEGVIAGSKRVRRILTTGPADPVQGDAKLCENSGGADATENHTNGRSER